MERFVVFFWHLKDLTHLSMRSSSHRVYLPAVHLRYASHYHLCSALQFDFSHEDND